MEMQERIKRVIKDYVKARGYPPAMRDIALAVSLKSTSSVHHYIKSLVEDGELEMDEEPGSPRALRVPSLRWVDVGGREGEINQLRDLYLHCQEMEEEPGSAETWRADVEALGWILEELE